VKRVKQIAVGFLAGAALMTLTAAPAAAQTTEISGGYAIQKWNSGWSDAAQGFAADLAQALHRSNSVATSVVVDFGWTRFSGEETDTTFVGGVRFKFMRDKPVSLFVQGTTGLVHWSEDANGFVGMTGNDFMVGGGGGVQIRLNDKVDIKPFQIDWWVLPNDNNDVITRMMFGVVFKLGPK
jgi:hypothetical protein